MRYTNQQYARALFETLIKAPEKQSVILKNFSRTLFKHRKVNEVKSIVNFLDTLIKNRDGKTNVEITVASEKDLGTAKKLFTGDFNLNIKIDPSLIAGAEVRIGDIRIKNSLKSRLEILKTAITN